MKPISGNSTFSVIWFLSIPIIVLFWKANGLSMFQVMVLQGLFAVAVILLEVPSGYFADSYGKRNTLLTASVFAVAGITFYSIGHSFLEFLMGEILWAVGVSLISGADSAMFYDTLVEMGKEDSYKEMWGKASFYYMISAGVAAIFGGLIGDINMRWALFAQIPIFAAMIPVAYSLKEPEHHKDVSGEEQQTMKAVVSDVFDRPKLRNLILYGAFIYAALQTAFWFYQPYFKLTGLDIASFGFIYAGFNAVSALSSKYAHWMEDKMGKALSLVALMAGVVVSLALMSSIVFAFSFVFIGLQQLARGFSKHVISDYINKIVGSENRSTILSTHSLIGRVFMSGMMPLFGYTADIFTLQQMLSLLSLTVFGGGLGAVFLFLLYSENVLEI